MTTDILDELKQAKQQQAEINAKIASLEKAKTDKDKADFKTAVVALVEQYKRTIAGSSGLAIWKEKEFAKLALNLGLQSIIVSNGAPTSLESTGDVPTEGEGIPKVRKSRSSVDSGIVLYFIQKGKVSVGDLEKHFEGQASKVTIGVRRKELLQLGKIVETKEGTKTFVQAV